MATLGKVSQGYLSRLDKAVQRCAYLGSSGTMRQIEESAAGYYRERQQLLRRMIHLEQELKKYRFVLKGVTQKTGYVPRIKVASSQALTRRQRKARKG